MPNRREFLAGSLAAGILTAQRYEVFAVEGSAAAQSLSLSTIPTPALLLDLDAFEFNVQTMAAHCRQAGCGLRPHAKTHKCPEIARRQVAAGAMGVCVATVSEAEALVSAGIRGVLLTSPIVEPTKIARVVSLLRGGGELMLSVGHARAVDLLAEAATAAGVKVDVLVDVDIGDRRTGVLPGEPALELARAIAWHKSLRLRGVQSYAGSASHVVGFEAREKASREAMAKSVDTRERLVKAGFEAAILSGGSTGTYNIDSAIRGVTELQAGSYVFMDVDYRRIGGRAGEVYTDFRPSLTVLATVVSAAHADRVSIDAGTKAVDTTTPHRPEFVGASGLTYGRGGDEFGIVTVDTSAKAPKLGDRLRMIVPHCDPSVNLYDRIYALRCEQVEGIWPVASSRVPPTR